MAAVPDEISIATTSPNDNQRNLNYQTNSGPTPPEPHQPPLKKRLHFRSINRANPNRPKSPLARSPSTERSPTNDRLIIETSKRRWAARTTTVNHAIMLPETKSGERLERAGEAYLCFALFARFESERRARKRRPEKMCRRREGLVFIERHRRGISGPA